MDPEQARKKALMDWIVARIAGKDYPKPVAVDAKIAEPDKTAVARLPKGVSFLKDYYLDSDKDLERFLNEIRSDPFLEMRFFNKMAETKEFADYGYEDAKNAYQSVIDVFSGKDPMGLRKAGYEKIGD